MKSVVAVFNQEKALVGAFSVIVQLRRLIVCSTSDCTGGKRGEVVMDDANVSNVAHSLALGAAR